MSHHVSPCINIGQKQELYSQSPCASRPRIALKSRGGSYVLPARPLYANVEDQGCTNCLKGEKKKKTCNHVNQCSKNGHTNFEQALCLSYCLLSKISSSISTLVRQPLVALDHTLSFKLSHYVVET